MYTHRQLPRCWEVQKLSKPDFSAIVNEICKKIENRNEREEAAEELLGHLEDTYERNIATGKSEQEAFDAAVEVLGDRVLLQQRLGAVHQHSPAAQMKQALWVFVAGFVLTKFIEIFFTDSLAGIHILINFFSTVCYLLALLLMRKVNNRLRKSFIFCASSFAVDIVTKCVNGFGIENEYISYVLIGINGILLACMWFYAIWGFMQMYSHFCSDCKKKKPHLGFALIFMPSEMLISAIAYITTEGKGIHFEGLIFVASLILAYIFIIIQFVRLKNCLWDAPAGYGIENWNKKNTTAAVTAIVLSFILPIFFMISYATTDTPKTELIIQDTNSPAEAEAIRAHMRSLGMDKEVLKLIPDSEVLNYKDAVALEIVNPSYFTNQLYEGSVYNFYFYDENATEKCQLRSLFVLDIHKCNYRVGMYYKSGDLFKHLIPTDDKEVYVSILRKEGNTLYKKEPISCDFTDFYNLVITGGLTDGFDFRGEENQTVLVALSYYVYNYNENFTPEHGFHFVTQRVPLTGPYNTVRAYANATIDYMGHNSEPTMEAYWFRDASMFSPEIIGQDYLNVEDYEYE